MLCTKGADYDSVGLVFLRRWWAAWIRRCFDLSVVSSGMAFWTSLFTLGYMTSLLVFYVWQLAWSWVIYCYEEFLVWSADSSVSWRKAVSVCESF